MFSIIMFGQGSICELNLKAVIIDIFILTVAHMTTFRKGVARSEEPMVIA